ncbi:hypothetical protein TRFO_22612 [Tritrichomonas foetus]|uniref:Uncharacterized protein n=1 Tax=Tritrichomonas foetus TaxID=1144522 RepID=A0A1J4KHH7_9EUKA|nr:hypothetical protein TRFO_22612 [Tritrichomonas foetus]|eukprot:OHT08781.1 hypothetical protein TRFO_22612 [Tritrichomonas foetus]
MVNTINVLLIEFLMFSSDNNQKNPNLSKKTETSPKRKQNARSKGQNQSPPPKFDNFIFPNIEFHSKPIPFQDMQLKVPPNNFHFKQSQISFFTGEKKNNVILNKIIMKSKKVSKKPSKLIFPSYLQLTDRKSPHLLAHEIIFDEDKNFSKTEKKSNSHKNSKIAQNNQNNANSQFNSTFTKNVNNLFSSNSENIDFSQNLNHKNSNMNSNLNSDNFDRILNDKLPNHNQELQAIYPRYGARYTLDQSNNFFFDLFYLSMGLNDSEFLNLVSTVHSYRKNEITKTRCHVHNQSIVSHNPSAHFLVPRLLSNFNFPVQENEKSNGITMNSKSPSTSNLAIIKTNLKPSILIDNESSGSEILQISNYFASHVSEFTDRREPPPRIHELPKYDAVNIPDNVPHITKSYIYSKSPMQDTAFGAFLFNSEYVSVCTGAEGENKGTNDEDATIEYRENLDQYFYSSASIPLMQTVGSTLMRAYSLLSCTPRPSFNRFPGYLLYSISLIFDKQQEKILNLMNNYYELVIPDINNAILNAINKTNEVTPQWDYYLTARNAIFSSKHILSYNKFASKNSIKIMNNFSDNSSSPDILQSNPTYKNKSKPQTENNSKKSLSEALKEDDGSSFDVFDGFDGSEYQLNMGKEENQVLHFLQSYIEEVYPNSSHKPFFKLFNSIQEDELLIIRPFAGAILMIPTLVHLFRDLDHEFTKRMTDELSLHGRDRLILKIAEKIAGPQKSCYDEFIVSDAPFSMKMFLEYAIVLRTAKKEILPQKLTFTNVCGFRLMMELDTFSSILSSFLISIDFKALCNLYKVQHNNPNINYQQKASEIIQGRDIIGIKKKENTLVFRKIVPSQLPQLSTSFMFLFDPSGPEQQMIFRSRSNETISQSISDNEATGESREPESDHENNDDNN